MNAAQISRGLRALARKDADLKQAIKVFGAPAPRIRPPGFETFLGTIVSQQISTAAASAILGRVKALLPSLSPAGLDAVSDDALRGAGLSYRKIEYLRGLAKAERAGSFQSNRLDTLSDDEAIAQITALKGFGVWTAEIYLMFSLGREDIFPANDLALQVALARLKGLETKPTPKQARALTAHWEPWRSVGSLFLWHYYQGAPVG
jgi:DNA-3-methyladenine glycosylase II